MRLPRLPAAVLTAAALTLSAAWGRTEDGPVKEVDKKFSGNAEKKPSDAEYLAMMKKKFLACKNSGDCKPYLLEKEKAKDKKDKIESFEGETAIPSALEAPVKPVSERAAAAAPAPGEPAAALVPAEGAAGAPPSGPPPTAAQTEAMRRAAGERRERTASRAAGAADSMRRSFFPAEEAAAQRAGAPERRTASAPAGAKTAPDPAEPRTVPELALAARSGFAATFRAQGLKVGAGPRGEPAIQRADGAPASEADLERLRTAVRADPAALTRRPDFFEILPREKFLDLKRDFAAPPELRSPAFQDIGMTARARDFQWSVSCSGLSGACNPHAGQASYRKGQDVPPEDLDAVWNAVQEEILDEDDEFGEYTEEDRRLAAAEDLAAEKFGAGRRSPSLASLLARMGELAREAGEGAGFVSARAVPAPGGRGVFLNDGIAREPRRGGAAAARGLVPTSGPPPAPEGRRAAGRRTGAYALAAAVAAALLLRGLRKKA